MTVSSAVEFRMSTLPIHTRKKIRSVHEESTANVYEELIRRIVRVAKRRPNKQEILDFCDGFRTGLSALLGVDLFEELESDVTGGLADTGIPESPSSLVSQYRKLGNGADCTLENYLKYVCTSLNMDTLLGEIQPILHRYSVDKPGSSCQYLPLWLTMLKVLFPACCGYEIVPGWREVDHLYMNYGQVIKRSTGSAEGKVVLVVLPRVDAWCGANVGDWEATIEYYLWALAEKLFDENVTYYPDRIFWFGFRGVHFGCGWQFKGRYEDRFWPADPAPYQDARDGVVVEAVRCMIQLMCVGHEADAMRQQAGRMVQGLL